MNAKELMQVKHGVYSLPKDSDPAVPKVTELDIANCILVVLADWRNDPP